MRKGVILGFFALLICTLPSVTYPQDDYVKEIEERTASFGLTKETKLEILRQLRDHMLSYAHLERKAALYGLPENLYYMLSDDSVADMDDMRFYGFVISAFARQRDAHTRFYYPDFFSCRQASIPLEFRFFRDSDREDSWGKVLVTKIKEKDMFKGLNEGDELVEYDGLEMRPLFEKMRESIAQSDRGFEETMAYGFLAERNGKYFPFLKEEPLLMLFKDQKSAELKEIEAKWKVDYSKCSDAALFSGIKFPEKKKKEKPPFSFASSRYSFEKIENPTGLTEELFVAGVIREKGNPSAQPYGYIKIRTFETFEDLEKKETINEFMDRTLLSLAYLMNNFAEMKVQALIIDTRYNPGGWIELAHHIARVFSRGKVNSVIVQFANGEWAMKALEDEISVSEKEIKAIKSRDVWSGFPYTRAFFNWDNYKAELLKVRSTSLRLAAGIPHFKEPTAAEGLNPLSAEADFPKFVLTDRFCVSSCDMFAAIMKDDGLARIVGERTKGAGGMVYEGKLDITGYGAKKTGVKAAIPFRYAYTNVLTPNYETIEDVGVGPDLYYRADLSEFRKGEGDGSWVAKVSDLILQGKKKKEAKKP